MRATGQFRPRPDQQIADRLLIVRARNERDADREQPVGLLANVALIVLGEGAGPPAFDFLDRQAADRGVAMVRDGR